MTGRVPKFAIAAESIRRLIGALPENARIPSQRELARRLGLGRNTIIAAMNLLADEGLIARQEKSRAVVVGGVDPHAGKLRSFLDASGFSAPRMAAAFRRQDDGMPGDRMISLINLVDNAWDGWLNQDLVAESLADAMKMRESERFANLYSELGLGCLREVVCRFEARRSIKASPDEVIIVSRRLFAYRLLTEVLLGQGTELWAPELSIVQYYGVGDRRAWRRFSLPFDGEGPSVEPLLRSKRRKFVMLEPTRPKPTGESMTEARRRAFVDLALSSDAFVMEDAYCELMYPERPTPLAALDPQRKAVIRIGAIPIWMAPGAELSWIIADRRIITALRAAMRRDYGAQSILGQFAAYGLLASGRIDEAAARTLQHHDALCLRIESILQAELGGLAEWTLPGSFGCVWLKLKAPISVQNLHRLRMTVDFQPGNLYGEADRSHLLLRYTASPENFAEGVRRLRDLILAASRIG